MHITSNTNISDALAKLRELEGRIFHASFMPQEELFGMLVAGTLVIDAITSTDQIMFTQEEIDFVVNLNNTIGDELVELQGAEEDYDQYDE